MTDVCVLPRPTDAGKLSPVRWSAVAFLAAVALLGAGDDAFADPPSGPRVCVAYDPEARRFGATALPLPGTESRCPEDYALIGLIPPLGPRREAKFVGFRGTCCPVPHGALTAEVRYVEESCPDASVATGVKAVRGAPDAEAAVEQTLYLLRCTAIDTAHYALGPAAGGEQFDITDEYITELRDRVIGAWYQPRSANPNWLALSAGIRYALGRLSLTSWEISACTGRPLGSLLTGKTNKYCGGMRYRELRAHGASGGGDATVELFPKCSAIDDEFSPTPSCLP